MLGKNCPNPGLISRLRDPLLNFLINEAVGTIIYVFMFGANIVYYTRNLIHFAVHQAFASERTSKTPVNLLSYLTHAASLTARGIYGRDVAVSLTSNCSKSAVISPTRFQICVSIQNMSRCEVTYIRIYNPLPERVIRIS